MHRQFCKLALSSRRRRLKYDDYKKACRDHRNSKRWRENTLLKEVKARYIREQPVVDIQQQLKGVLSVVTEMVKAVQLASLEPCTIADLRRRAKRATPEMWWLTKWIDRTRKSVIVRTSRRVLRQRRVNQSIPTLHAKASTHYNTCLRNLERRRFKLLKSENQPFSTITLLLTPCLRRWLPMVTLTL